MRYRTVVSYAPAAAALLALVMPTGTAQAATGTFLWTQYGAIPHVLTDPADDTCYPTERGTGVVHNQTDREAVVYLSKDCSGREFAGLKPGRYELLPAYNSVKFTKS